MDFYMKLPRSKKEFSLFIAVISIISVNIIAPVITCFEFGFTHETWREAMKVVPFIWLSVVVFVLITYKPAEWMTAKILKREDSFNAHIIVNILCTVLLMSIILTVVGSWIGSGKLTLEPVKTFFYKWPRNFTISFVVEAIIAQPIARFVIFQIHRIKDKKEATMES